MGKMIYLDNAATTKTAPEVVEQCCRILQSFMEMLQPFMICGKQQGCHRKRKTADRRCDRSQKEEIYLQQVVPSLITGL